MLKKVFFLTLVVGAFTFVAQKEASAQCVGGNGASNITCTNDSATVGSATLGFDPSGALMDAVTNTDPTAGPCFTCPNPNAGGTTAGALTNSMFGTIRLNADADLGDKSFNASVQGLTIPTAKSCTATNCNDSGAFTFSMPLPTMDALSAGTATVSNPDPGVPVGTAGARVTVSNTFTYNADGSTAFDQTIEQLTFTEGQSGNDLQHVIIQADSASSPNVSPAGGSDGVINYSQTITEGDFVLGPLTGSFLYNVGVAFNVASGFGANAPTGPDGTTVIPGN
ncbi:hypothetical protein MNBD_NITROSPIRAE01-1015 [hydrothermal vent metagenome]|uniref:Uncharacterized protein n=1 Tax=hydrothermal vent metagenome TaxID=652676 RepID=A0A3B1D6J3_9ZZZZ